MTDQATEDADRVLDLALARAARLGVAPVPVRLVCVDGPAGSGKTTLAADVAARADRRGVPTRTVHMDDLYHGWEGLPAAPATVRRELVEPLRAGRPGGYRRWDWVAGRWAEWVEVPPVSLLLVEGVGSGSASYADAICVLVWVEAPRDVRLARGLARDGEPLRARWEAFQADEDRLHAQERTRERADLRLDGARVAPVR